MHGEHRAKNNSQGSRQEQIEKIANETRVDNDTNKGRSKHDQDQIWKNHQEAR